MLGECSVSQFRVLNNFSKLNSSKHILDETEKYSRDQYYFFEIFKMVKLKKKESVFAKNLQNLLIERGITQKQLAEIAGVSCSVLHSWLNGVSPTELDSVLKIATAFNVDFQFLLTGVRQLPTTFEDAKITDLFDIEEESSFCGVFQIEAKRLKQKMVRQKKEGGK